MLIPEALSCKPDVPGVREEVGILIGLSLILQENKEKHMQPDV